MSKTGTTRVTVKPGEPLPRGETDWERLKAMTDEEVIAAALSDPDAQPMAPEQLAKMRRVSRVKVLRQRLGMTQAEFAEAFHLPITTLRDWEQHRSTPASPRVVAGDRARSRGDAAFARGAGRIGSAALAPRDQESSVRRTSAARARVNGRCCRIASWSSRATTARAAANE